MMSRPAYFLLTLLTISHLAHAIRKDAETGPVITDVVLHIISRVPNQPTGLKVHCQSNDTDVGTHYLYTGQEFHWKFLPQPPEPTIFSCHFNWGFEFKTFDVYDSSIDTFCADGGPVDKPNNCFWEARTSGFYISKDNRIWLKLNTWDPFV
ncbi:hypothetical protein Vadar_014880 [Vaccinium darrowii]|uniref:Uncharacterized protein n=1 Tax=Vaccinium darrowii TaxID=229202 RepID=A0ACB7X0X3_9ERIC|nr:hypothetical protein Vadar_014880 [Vaccinium darrowii]